MKLKEYSSPFRGHDPRTGLGYGVIDPQFNDPRSIDQYPAITPEDLDAEEEIEDETYEAILSKLISYSPGDPYAKNKTDPFYYAAGNNKLRESNVAKGISPFPNMYKNRTQTGFGGAGEALPHGGPTYGFRTRIRPTGTKHGFSKAPAPFPEEEIINNKYSLEDILNTDPDQENLDKFEDIVSLIHSEQEDIGETNKF